MKDIKATTIRASDARRWGFRVVALRPMGLKAQRSNSPFIVREAA